MRFMPIIFDDGRYILGTPAVIVALTLVVAMEEYDGKN